MYFFQFRCSHSLAPLERAILEKFENSHDCTGVLFLKLAGQQLLKQASTADIPRIFCIILEKFFYRTLLGDCLWQFWRIPKIMIIMIIKEAATQRCSVKKMFLEIWQNSQENTWARVSLLMKLCNFIKKEPLARFFPANFVKFPSTPFYIEHLWVAASLIITFYCKI